MMDFISQFGLSLTYISQAPYFWLSMGMVCAIAMFIGAIIYDGELENAYKGIISVGMYGFFLFQIIFTRVSANYGALSVSLSPAQVYANLTTVIVVSIGWLIGIGIGVYASSLYHTHPGSRGEAL